MFVLVIWNYHCAQGRIK